MSNNEIREYVITKLIAEYCQRMQTDEVWAWQTTREAVMASDVAQKREVIRLLRNSDAVRDYLRQEAGLEADEILSNGQITLEEFARLI